MADETVNYSTRQGFGHSPNAVAYIGKVIGAIKTSTDNVVASSKKRRLFMQVAVSNFP